MQAAVFSAPGECEIVERDTPLPEEGHVAVQVEACGVCGTDVHIFRGEFPARLPIVAGHEFAGVVRNAGEGVAALRPGDRVVVDPNVSCGSCRPCRRGLTHLCRNLQAYGVTEDGGFATHCCLPARQCHKLPPEMSFDVAAMTEPVACCVHGIERAQIRPGDVVVLIGAGMIGLVLLQLALLRGAGATVVSEPVPEKRDLARRLGASHVVDPGGQDLRAVVMEETEGLGADVAIDCVGGAEVAQQAAGLVGEGGRILLFGVAPEEARMTLAPYDIYRREISLTGSFTNPYTHFAALSLLSSGRIDVGTLISHRLELGELPAALELLEARKATKIIIEPQR